KFELFAPAPKVLHFLRDIGEVHRLERLRHLGVLERSLQGISHTRWDYTASMLYVATKLRPAGTSRKVMFGKTCFSSFTAAVQVAALLSNIGHLPGTFAVEKGVMRWLHARNATNPASALPWPETR